MSNESKDIPKGLLDTTKTNKCSLTHSFGLKRAGIIVKRKNKTKIYFITKNNNLIMINVAIKTMKSVTFVNFKF